MKIEVFKQSAIKLKTNVIIYFDPFDIKQKYNDADYIFITHDHYDHYDVDAIKNVINDKTLLIVPECLAEQALQISKNLLIVDVCQTYDVDDIHFETIPAYNITKKYHPRDKKYVGYNILLEGQYYYIMGDTDATEEALKVKCDVCFVPIGGTFTMGALEAAEFINKLRPKKVIPIHYGSIVGDISLKDTFCDRINKEIKVEIYIQ